MSDTAVSLLILTYNRFDLSSQYIPKLLDTVGDVSYEVLIWDNGSTDGTLDWLYNYSRINQKITKLFTSEKNWGLEAVNFLAEEAVGRYIIKVDDDIRIPYGFARNLIAAYETVSEPKLAYLAYDIQWGRTTYATRAGMGLYQKDAGRIVGLSNGDRVLITYHPDRFTLASMCRLSLRKTFFDLGKHPAGVIYGVDKLVSDTAARGGMYCGFLTGSGVIEHMGFNDKPAYRALKNQALKKHN
jgi:glycosyltransferase involved in cell wall biosynthesis